MIYHLQLTNDQLEGLRALLFAHDLGEPDFVAGSPSNDRDVQLSEPQVRFLEQLPEDHDGHIDAEGVMWIGGMDAATLTAVHNE